MQLRNNKKAKWQINTTSIYKFRREERLQSAYEIILPEENYKIKEVKNDKPETCSNRAIR